MAKELCFLRKGGGGKTKHTDTFTLTSGSGATQTQDMGEDHEYRYAKYPYTTIRVSGTLYITVYFVRQGGAGYTQSTSKSSGYTITINALNKTYSISGNSIGRFNETHGGTWTGVTNAAGECSFNITSVTYT